MSALALLPLVGVAALAAIAAAGWRAERPRPWRFLSAARIATGLALAAAVAGASAVVLAGPVSAGALGLGLRLDAVSVTLLVLVSFVGVVVVGYSRAYLEGEARQGAFVAALAATLAAVSLLVTAGTLLTLVVAWVATSLALHRLLLFYGDRRRAAMGARKKFIIARAGDVALVTAAVLLWAGFGTGDIGAILEGAAAAGETGAVPEAALWAAAFIALAAVLKSAQFPFHGWLPEVIDTPTPVSALLHAGIINAGGFLVVRFADVMVLTPGSLAALAVVGGFTALFGAVVMLTQTSIKGALAWSTVSQMGFMLLQCGLGAFALAVLHIVAHSLYKAHAFLSSGSVVAAGRPAAARLPSAARIGVAFGLAVAVYAAVGGVAHAVLGTAPAVLALGAILVLGLTQLMAPVVGAERAVMARVGAAALGVSVLYVALQALAGALYGPALPPVPAAGPAEFAIMALAVVSFALVTLGQLFGPRLAHTKLARAAGVHIANGFYVNAIAGRLVGAWRLPAAQRA